MGLKLRNKMPTYEIKYRHNKMRPDYIGSAIKYASNERDAVIHLSKGNIYDSKSPVIIDRQNNVLTILSVNQI